MLLHGLNICSINWMHRIFSSYRPSSHHIFAWNLCCFGSLIKDLSMQLFWTLFLKVEIWAKCCDRDLKVVISRLLVLRWRQWGSFFDFIVLINFWAANLKQVNLVFIQRWLRSRSSGAVDVGSSLLACALVLLGDECVFLVFTFIVHIRVTDKIMLVRVCLRFEASYSFDASSRFLL